MALRRLQPLSITVADISSERLLLFLGLSGCALLATEVLPLGALRPVLTGAAVGLLWLVALASGLGIFERIRRRFIPADLKHRLDTEPGPAILTDRAGICLAGNAHADGFGNWRRGVPLSRPVRSLVANPETTLARLAGAALSRGSASEALGLVSPRPQLRVRRIGRNRLLWTLAEAATDPDLAILCTGPQGVACNPAAERLFGPGPFELADLVLDLPVRLGGRHRVKTASGVVEARLFELSSNGDASEFGIVPIQGEAGRERTDQVLAQPELLTALPVPMLKIAADGALLEANDEARTILSLNNDVLPPLFELVEGMGRPISDWLADAAQGRGLLKPEIVRAVIPGQELYLQIALGRTTENGKPILVGILNDATELKTLEAQFVQSQKMQAIGQLAGGVAHDFNNLLTAISGHCDLLLLRHDAGDPEYSDLIQISQNANRAASLVGQLLAFSRKQNLKPQSLDLRDTMLDLAHLLNRLIGEKIRLDVTHAPGPQMIRADRRQFEQVIVNLVVNARDAMSDGGTITIETRSEILAEELLRDRARLTPGDYVVIEVQDTGAGIPADGLSKIFEPFYTTKKTGEGTGLGLSTAYGIVKQTGGFIFVDSTVGEGTTFSLYFPAAQAAASKEPEAEAPVPRAPAPARGDGVILLVEDEAPVRAFASRALRLRGYSVVEAENAEEALTVLEDGELNVDVFVTDVIMPGMDGPTWVRQALKARPDTRVVFMSGYAEEGRAEKQARIPNSVFLPKPFSLQQLTGLVQEQLQ